MSLIFTTSHVLTFNFLYVLHHLPYAAGTDACAEAAADAFVLIDYVFICPAFMLDSAYCPPVTGGLAHMAVAAGGAGHAFVCLFLGLEISRANFIVFLLNALVRNDLFDLRLARRVHKLIVYGLRSKSPLPDGMRDKPETCCITNCKYFDIRGLADPVDCQPAPFSVDAGRQKVEDRRVTNGNDYKVCFE